MFLTWGPFCTTMGCRPDDDEILLTGLVPLCCNAGELYVLTIVGALAGTTGAGDILLNICWTLLGTGWYTPCGGGGGGVFLHNRPMF